MFNCFKIVITFLICIFVFLLIFKQKDVYIYLKKHGEKEQKYCINEITYKSHITFYIFIYYEYFTFIS